MAYEMDVVKSQSLTALCTLTHTNNQCHTSHKTVQRLSMKLRGVAINGKVYLNLIKEVSIYFNKALHIMPSCYDYYEILRQA